jgi:putative ABC transport system substrate-binding protein
MNICRPLCFGLAILLAASCGVSGPETGSADAPLKRVAIATLMTHPTMDEILEHMKATIAAHGYREGESVLYDVGNANGDQNLAVTIVRELDRRRPDVMVALTTPMAQVAAKDARSPIVFSAVTDPVGAGVVDALTSPAPNVTGVSDAWPYRSQLALIRQILQDAERLGVVFSPGEAASQYGMARIRELAPGFGFGIVEIPVSNTLEILGSLRTRIGDVDAVYLSSDNTVTRGLPAALKVALDNDTPLFAGDSGTVANGALAAVSVGYAGVGRSTGELVVRVLRGERSIPVIVADSEEVHLNTDTARRLGVAIPRAVCQRAVEVFGAPCAS